MALPNHIYSQAKTAAKQSGVTHSIFRLEKGTYVIVPEGYDIPNVTVTLVGKVDRYGNFTPDDNESLLQRD